MRIPRKLKKKCKSIAKDGYLTEGYGVTNLKHIRITDVDHPIGFYSEYVKEFK